MPMRIVHMGFYQDPEDRAPAELLRAWPTLVDVAESVTRAGARVTVVQACSRSQLIHQNGVAYHFMPGAGVGRVGRGAFAALMRTTTPHLLHVHGLGFAREVSSLAEIAPGIPILLQDHASRPPHWWCRRAWRRCSDLVSGVAFCSRQQARAFIDTGALGRDLPVYEIPESTSRFTPGGGAAARNASTAEGNPLLLWVGHLDVNKDPITVLDGVAEAARTLPDLRLWCCFGKAPLLPRVRRRIAADPLLAERVRLLGHVLHTQVEQLMRAADFFVSGSHREGSGYALIEALACGLPPIVTDIPSFRALTGTGAVGRLWRPGDAHALCSALLESVARAGVDTRAAVSAHFERELSIDALGRKLAAVYAELVTRAERAGRPGPQPRTTAMRA